MQLVNISCATYLILLKLMCCGEAMPYHSHHRHNNKDQNSTIVRIKKLPSDNVLSPNINDTEGRIIFRGSSENDRYSTDLFEQDIIFPDTFQVVFESIPRINGPPKCAEGSTFCERFETYPHGHVRDILRRKQLHTDLFGRDEEPDDEAFNINNRVGDSEEFLCASLVRTVFPKVGKNKNNKWKYIINQQEPEGYIQGVRIETCRQKDAPCDILGDLPTGYVTSCKQKYIFRRMMSLNEKGDPVPDTFALPSACCCSYKRDVPFLARFGGQVTPRTREP